MKFVFHIINIGMFDIWIQCLMMEIQEHYPKLSVLPSLSSTGIVEITL